MGYSDPPPPPARGRGGGCCLPFTLTCARSPDGDVITAHSKVIPCLLEGDGMVDALDLVTTCGKIVLYGCIGVCSKPFDFFKMHRKRCVILSTEPKRDVDMRRYFEEGVQYVMDGLVNTSEMVTHTFPLERVDEAFKLRNDKSASCDAIHVLIDCERKDGAAAAAAADHDPRQQQGARDTHACPPVGGGGGGGGGSWWCTCRPSPFRAADPGGVAAAAAAAAAAVSATPQPSETAKAAGN